jgi:nitroreductase
MGRVVAEEVRRLRETVRPDLQPAASRYLDHFLHFTSAPLVVAPIWRAGPELLAPAAPPRAGEDALASGAAAVENLLLAAHALGLGACWMTGPLVAERALCPLLSVPEGWRLAALVPVGKPAEEPSPAPPRRDPDRLVQRLR